MPPKKYFTEAERRVAVNAQSVCWRRKERARRRAILNEIKMSAGCADCGYAKAPVALDFDHRDPSTKSFNVSAGVDASRPWAIILTEIEKCDVVCANCHRIRTFGVVDAS